MIGAVIILAIFGFIGWLHYLKNQQKRAYLQSKEAYLRDIMGRYPSAESLEKLVQSNEWTTLMEAYGKPPVYDNRLTVLLLVAFGILAYCISIAAFIVAVYVEWEIIIAAIILSSIGTGLMIIAIILNHYFKKWKL